ncbi:MAG: hypothetical protein L3J54_04260 [Draconibacterium sp.]|nr:hypothetical protein [Draconibacterium sp.]
MKNHNNTYPNFSFFKSPVTNIYPAKTIGLLDAYKAISGKYFAKQTQQLRLISDKKKNREYKASRFPYVCFSGIFSKRNEKSLIKHSGLIAIDFDHLENVKKTKLQLIKDPYFETQLLFVSPNGNGIKWVIEIEVSEQYPHGEMFRAIYNYILKTHLIEVDRACKDLSRATFLCHDPEAWIHPKYLII